MKNQWIRTTTVLVLAMIMTAGVNAQVPGGKGKGPCGQGDGPGLHQGNRPGEGEAYKQRAEAFGPHKQAILDLTEDQKAQLSSLRVQQYKTMKPMRAEMGELKARERTLMSQEEVDVKALYKVIDQQTELINKIRKEQLTQKLAFREILTDEQLMKLDQKQMLAGKIR